ncbi:hypothetical protein AVEN_206751-1 [Araneus ventricosus]|uniref:Uncharacterized protein n=1 Tax=Araneus ventricosus TaxID=182803 RepID=A0A4Y2C6N5_ARAVE|nr:hypothetical protein AVEN_206751-1 [Araneus ventricosus]
MAIAQDSDYELRFLLEPDSGLDLKELSLPSSKRLLQCDISTGWIRPYVPKTFLCKVSRTLHVSNILILRQQLTWASSTFSGNR